MCLKCRMGKRWFASGKIVELAQKE